MVNSKQIRARRRTLVVNPLSPQNSTHGMKVLSESEGKDKSIVEQLYSERNMKVSSSQNLRMKQHSEKQEYEATQCSPHCLS
jgi:hypothetical protein